jgi:hypothetical protein
MSRQVPPILTAIDRSGRPRLLLDARWAVIRTTPPPARTSCSTRAVAASA